MLDIGEVTSMCEKQKGKELKSESKYYIPVMISLIIGVIYSSGLYYSFNYLSYFHLYALESLSIPPIYYIVNAAIPILISILILYPLSFKLPDSRPRLKAGIHNFTVLIFPAFISIYYGMKIESSISGYVIALILVIYYFDLLWSKVSIRHWFLVPDSIKQVTNLLFITVILLCTIGAVGELSAMHTTEGDTIIAFNWNGNPSADIGNKDLVPIIHFNGIYYVAERMKPAPKNPVVYAIPENKVESAVIKVINQDNSSKR